MTTLTVKGIPNELYALLKRRAAEHRRSMNAEILVCLERALRSAPTDPAAALDRADAVREHVTGPPLTAADIRRARTRGRP